MYAVIGAGANQQKVAEGQQVRVDLLDAEEGEEVTLAAKMVVDGDTVLATPDQLGGVTVTGRVVGGDLEVDDSSSHLATSLSAGGRAKG